MFDICFSLYQQVLLFNFTAYIYLGGQSSGLCSMSAGFPTIGVSRIKFV